MNLAPSSASRIFSSPSLYKIQCPLWIINLWFAMGNFMDCSSYMFNLLLSLVSCMSSPRTVQFTVYHFFHFQCTFNVRSMYVQLSASFILPLLNSTKSSYLKDLYHKNTLVYFKNRIFWIHICRVTTKVIFA